MSLVYYIKCFINRKKLITFISYHVLFSFIVFILIQIVITIILCYYDYSKILLIVSRIFWIVYLINVTIVLLKDNLYKLSRVHV